MLENLISIRDVISLFFFTSTCHAFGGFVLCFSHYVEKFAIRVTVLIHSLRTFKQHSVIFSSPGVWVMLTPFLLSDCMMFYFFMVIISARKATTGKAEPRPAHKGLKGRHGAGNRRHEIRYMPLSPCLLRLRW